MAKWERRLKNIEKQKVVSFEAMQRRDARLVENQKKKLEEDKQKQQRELLLAVVQKFAEKCAADIAYYSPKICVRPGQNNNSWKIEYSNFDYEPNINFDFLLKFSEYFKTKNINIRSSKDADGCESCGHGASWSFVLSVNDVAPFANWYENEERPTIHG